ncbi:MAG: group II intron reverse transcriptase/maturase [Candidatus Thermoplasmatota archaeon]|nr:group II intron reverse transcriptase/maturase [Candidatus Thermoplasmatota archaeon]
MNAYTADDRLNERAQQLCEKLYLAAKKSKTRRFHQLYDKVYRMDILSDSWNIVKRNRGCAGVDGIGIVDVIKYGQDKYLQELHDLMLDTHKYHPRKIKRVYIPKANGKQRPLGIPVIRDRIVQTATKTLLEPIFEAGFLECSYGFRPNRSAHDALEEIRVITNKGYTFVLDADISGYFDSINHAKLLEFVHLRISDKKILKLIRKWLKCGIVDEEEIKENQLGTPQGGVISPLLANIYLHEFDRFWAQQTQVKGKLIRYCDDFVILFASREDAELGQGLVKTKMAELHLKLNTEKTKIVDMRCGEEGFDFLGFHHRPVMSHRYKRRYTLKWPRKAAVNKIKWDIREKLETRVILKLSLEEVVKLLNPVLRGWMNYFKFGNSSKVFNQIDSYVHERLAIWWSKKHQRSGRRWKTDFTWMKHRESGVLVMNGNVQ